MSAAKTSDTPLLVLAIVLALACLFLQVGCSSLPPGRSLTLINFAPSVKFQVGGSDARVDVNNEQNGDDNNITKETPVDARFEDATSLDVKALPQ